MGFLIPQRSNKTPLLIVLLTAAIASTCKEGTTPTAPTPVSVVSVAISGNASLTAVGQASQLTATATLSDGTTQNVTSSAAWQSSSSAVATVSSTGLFTAVTAGTTTVTATYQRKAGILSVTVSTPPSFAFLNRTATGNSVSGRGPGTGRRPFAFLAGTWAGTWTDTRYNVSGTLNATFTMSGSTVTTRGVIGLASLGLGNESGSGVGTISGQTLNFTFSSSTVGNGSGTLEIGGAGSGTGTVTAPLNFGAFTFTGNVTPTMISGTFNFTSPTGGHGVASLTKQ